jgi:hypothetical protein
MGREALAACLEEVAETRRALERARAWFVDRRELEVDAVWLLGHLTCGRPEDRLAGTVRAERARLRGTRPWGRFLDPAQEGPELPRDQPGEVGLARGIAAAIGEPDDVARETLRGFVGRELAEYDLTHQLLALVWWEEMGRGLPLDLPGVRVRLMQRLAAEHARDPKFSDLYAERAMLMAIFGPKACPSGLREWARVVRDAQGDGGAWLDPRDAVGSAGTHLPPASAHTSVLSMAVLEARVRCVDGELSGKAFTPWRGWCGPGGPWSAR